MSISAPTLVIQALVFLAFVLFTMKFVWPPIMNAIKERQKTIADGLAAAEKGDEALQVAEQEREAIVAEARTQASEIISSAKDRDTQMVDEARVRAEEEAAAIVARAKTEAEQEFAEAKEALRKQVAALAVAGAERILAREVDAANHADILEGLSAQLDAA